MKKCSICGQSKDISEFNKKKKNVDGLSGICKTCRQQKDKKYREKNRDRINKNRREYISKNHDKAHQWNSKAYMKRKDQQKEYFKIYVVENKDRMKLIKHNYKVKRRLQEQVGNLSKNLIKKLKILQDNRCFYCNNILEEFHLDHIIPLSKNGEHKDYNIVLSCPKCNLSKGSKDPEIFVNKILGVA